MKQLIATNKDTGQKVQFAWDKPGNPTKEDLDLIFADKSKGGKEDLMAQNKPVNSPGFPLNSVLQQAQQVATGKVGPVKMDHPPVVSSGRVGPVGGSVTQSVPSSTQGKDRPEDHSSSTLQTLWQKIQDLLGSKTEEKK